MVESIDELRKVCSKGEGPDSFENWRRLALYITRLLLHTNITANQITMLSATIGVIAGIFMANGNPSYMFIGAILFYFHFIFDLVDGQIARYRKSSSLTGAYVERLVHYIVNAFVFFSIAFGLYTVFQNVWVFALGFSAALSQTLIALAREMKFVVISRALLGYKGYNTKQAKDWGTKIEAKEEGKNRGGRVVDAEESQLISSSSTIYTISRYGYRIVTQPYRLHIMLLSATIGLIFPSFTFFSFTFNALYLFLYIYGIFSPLIWIGWIFLAVKTKAPDRLFSSIS